MHYSFLAIIISSLVFSAPSFASDHKGKHHEMHDDKERHQSFKEHKREKMQRYRNNEMVHNCINNADTKRDIGLCIKEHKAERKAYREEHRDERDGRREEHRDYMQSLNSEERKAKRQEYRDERHQYYKDHEEREEKRDKREKKYRDE